MNKSCLTPEVSIIVPNYNSGTHLCETIGSIIKQDFENWELIIVDDFSNDNSLKMAKEKHASNTKIRFIELENNFGGPARPRNIGIEHARGNYLAFLDADDIWHPMKLKVQIDFMKKTGSPFCCTEMRDFRNSKDYEKFYNKRDYNFSKISKITHTKLLLKDIIPTSSVILRRELVKDRIFHESSRYVAVEDYLLWLQIHEELKYSIKIQVPLLYYRKHCGSISKNKFKQIKRIYMMMSEYVYANGNKIGKRRFFFMIACIYFSIKYRIVQNKL